MEVIDQFWQARVGVDQIFTKSDRMRRSEAKTLQTLDFVDGIKQLHKWTLIADLRKLVTAVEVYDLTEQGHFFYAARNKLADFGEDLLDCAAPLSAARLGHDAKCAMHVASLHDRDKRGRLFRHQLLMPNGGLRAGFFVDVDD